ncbi:hypothetical protein KSX_34760 [Ktedonospora formicarum]|uniref:Uncharacterized protein n=1 Tax=Ktedonospora formicarum TaxID=2778364 RepID=A0A8J3MT65_9CHLR|nr:hypothetical protein KSX_34760 [Ktedonospora formicarum]
MKVGAKIFTGTADISAVFGVVSIVKEYTPATRLFGREIVMSGKVLSKEGSRDYGSIETTYLASCWRLIPFWMLG